jgi:ribose transport system substrate-binding protein
MHRGVRQALYALTSVTALALAACSSSGSSSSASAPASTASSQASEAATSSSSSPEVAQALQMVAQASKRLSIKDIHYSPGPLKGSVAGKVVAFMTNQTSAGQAEAKNAAAAAHLLGLKLQVVTVGPTAEDTANDFGNLVNEQNLAGVIAPGYDPTTWQSAYNALSAKGVPIVLDFTSDQPQWQQGKTVTLIRNDIYNSVVNTAAAWMVADSGGHANIVAFDVPASQELTLEQDQLITELKKLCPACTVATQNTTFAAIGTSLPGQIVSYVQQHPDTKYIYLAFADLVAGVEPALKAAGISGVKIVTENAGSQDVQFIKGGDESADAAFDNSLVEYIAVDTVARLILGQSAQAARTWTMPLALLTSSDINDGEFSSTAPSVVQITGLQSFFQQLWATK